MEFLKAIIGDKYPELEAVITAYNALPENKDKQVKLADLGTGEYVGIGKYNARVAERDGIQEKLDTARSTITTLKKDMKDNETLQQTIKTHETTIRTLKTTYEDKIKEMRIEAAIQAKLTHTKYPELLYAIIDKTKLSLSEDGLQVFGIDEQLLVLKETYKDLFTTSVNKNDPQNNVKTPPMADRLFWQLVRASRIRITISFAVNAGVADAKRKGEQKNDK